MENVKTNLVKNRILWTLQMLLALLFLFAGLVKVVMPAEQLAAQSHLPVGFLRFIGVAEALGALGLIFPGLLRIRERLTPLAAAGLLVIISGAVVISYQSDGVGAAALPAVVGMLLGFVCYGRLAETRVQ